MLGTHTHGSLNRYPQASQRTDDKRDANTISTGMEDRSFFATMSGTAARGDAETNTDSMALIPPDSKRAVETWGSEWQIMTSISRKIDQENACVFHVSKTLNLAKIFM